MVNKTLLRYFNLILGAVIAAFALEEFLVPCQILDGGIVGISIIISSLTPISLGILTICLNLPFVLAGAKQLEKYFWLRTLVSMIVFSIFLEVFRQWHFNVTYDALLATVFGGVILGLGVGLIIRNGGCLDGTETVAIMVSRKTSFSVGQIVLICNIIIYMTAGLLFGLDRALYSLLTYFITSKTVDYINTGLDQGKAVMIITNEARQIADDIYETLGRTVTFMNGEGLISGEKTILYCVITRMELSTLRKIIEKDDYSAFMTVSDVSEIVGHHIKSSNKNLVDTQNKSKSENDS
ncbi:MAG: YitT family protein [Lachnospiraceae bacterium]|nr:YitT family protein [Lachnospiraceae bacterium]